MPDRKQRTLVIEQGRTLRQPFRILVNGAVLDPVGAGYTTGILQVRDKHVSEGGDVLYELTTEDGGIVLGAYDDGTGTWWSGYLYGPSNGPNGTGLLLPWGEALHEFVLFHTGGDVDTVSRGPAILLPMTTEVTP